MAVPFEVEPFVVVDVMESRRTVAGAVADGAALLGVSNEGRGRDTGVPMADLCAGADGVALPG